MLLIINILFILATIFYCHHLMRWRKAWLMQKSVPVASPEELPKLSVVVAMHNEEKYATQLLNTLMAQTLRPTEIIVVLDHCTDNTANNVRQAVQHSDIQITVLNNNQQQGKKFAQRIGVERATSTYIAVTDADCLMSAQWLSALSHDIATTHADLLIAPVAMTRHSNQLFQRLAEIEFLALQAVSAGTALCQHATMCNGANLAFRRTTYLRHNAHSQYISGDDMFLLSEVKRQGGKVAYALCQDSLVQTSCPPTAQSYYKQRTRWLRKASGYTDADVKQLSLVVFCGNVAWPIALFSSIYVALGCLLLKTIAETLLLSATHKHWKLKLTATDIAILAIVYPFNLLIISTLSLFRNKQKW